MAAINGAKWIPIGIGLIMAGIAFSELVLQPIRERIQYARDNVMTEFARIEGRVDAMDVRLRAIESACK
jgi:hypothetical protein